jgi:transcriptional regulator
MYLPKHFIEDDPQILLAWIRRVRVGHFITVSSNGPDASFIPLLISDDLTTITGHLAKANNQWKRANVSIPAMVSWIGPDAYVSPNYYPTKLEHGKVVPTWNFITIQALGSLTLHDDDEWKLAQVSSLTDFNESDTVSPWRVSDAPSEYIDTMLKAIVGFEIHVTSLEGKWKLSQNRAAEDIEGVINGLKTVGSEKASHVAREMSQ